MAEFPHHTAGTQAFRIGDIDGDDTATTGTGRCHQHGLPGRVEVGVADDRVAIHVEAMAVIGIAQASQVGHQLGRNVSPLFDTGFGIKRVQHAIVGADVDHPSAQLIAGTETLVGIPTRTSDRQAIVTEIGGRHERRGRIDDIAEQPSAVTERSAVANLTGIGATQPIDPLRAEAIRDATRTDVQGSLLRCRQLIPAECRRREVAATDRDVARSVGWHTTVAVPAQIADAAIRVDLEGQHLATPVDAVEPRLEDQGIGIQTGRIGSGRCGRAEHIFGDHPQGLFQDGGQFVRGLGIQHLTPTIDGRVVEIIHLDRAAIDIGILPGRRVVMGVANAVVADPEDVAARTQGDAEVIDVRIPVAVQPDRWIGAGALRRDRHLATFDVGPERPLEIAHCDVGQGLREAVAERHAITAVGIADPGPGPQLRKAIGELEGEVLLTGQLDDIVVVLELTTHEVQCFAIGRTAAGAGPIQEIEQIVTTVVDVPHDQRIEIIDPHRTDPHGRCLTEGPTLTITQGQGALAVILEPIREILNLVVVAAAAREGIARLDLVAAQAATIGCQGVNIDGRERSQHRGFIRARDTREYIVGGRVGGSAVECLSSDAVGRRGIHPLVVGRREVIEALAVDRPGGKGAIRAAHALEQSEGPVGCRRVDVGGQVHGGTTEYRVRAHR